MVFDRPPGERDAAAENAYQEAANGRQGPAQAEADLEEGVSLATKLNYAAAGARLHSALRQFEAVGDEHRAAEATFWLGYCSEKLGRPDAADTFYSRLLERYPTAATAEMALRGQAALGGPPMPPTTRPATKPNPS